MSLRFTPVLVALMLGSIACGDDDSVGPIPGDGGAPDGGAMMVPLAELPIAFAGAVCAGARQCLSADIVDIFLADCENTIGRQLRADTAANFQAAVDAGRLTYHPERLAACLTAVREGGCAFLDGTSFPACNDVLVGTAALGAPCSMNEECPAEAFCDMPGACPGTCATRRSSGANCEANEECMSGLVCNDAMGGMSARTCGAPAGPGEQCEGSTGRKCRSGLFCIGAMDNDPGTCADVRARQTGVMGSPCMLETGPWCADGLSCTAESIAVFTCQNEATAGGPCGVSIPDVCPDGHYCNANPRVGQFTGTCAVLPAVGSPCATPLFGVECAAGALCVSGTCRAREDNGGPCMVDEQCYGGRCEGGTCAAPAFCTGS